MPCRSRAGSRVAADRNVSAFRLRRRLVAPADAATGGLGPGALGQLRGPERVPLLPCGNEAVRHDCRVSQDEQQTFFDLEPGSGDAVVVNDRVTVRTSGEQRVVVVDGLVVEYAPRSARAILCLNGNAKKPTVATEIIRRYPELAIYKIQTHAWKETFWLNMFDAAAVGAAYLIEQKILPPTRRPSS